MAQVAIAWSLQAVCAPIIGINSVERLDDLIKGLDIKLAPEELQAIEKDYQPQTIKGHV